MVVELLAKDKHEKLQYQGKCKLTIDTLSNMLLVEPFNEDFKLICALFRWKFVAQKNILFIFAEYDFQDFALVFDNSNKCKKIYRILLKKGACIGKSELVKKRFWPPLFAGFSVGTASISKLKEIFFKWIEKLDRKEKEEFIQLLKDKNVYDLIYPDNNERKRRRKHRSITGICDTYENPPPKKVKLLRNDVFNKKIVKPNFQLFCYTKKGIHKKTLITFCPTNKKLCYQFYWSNFSQFFVCLGCEKIRNVYAKIYKDANGEECVKQNRNQHICELREFDPSKYRNDITVQKPLYEIVEDYIYRKEMTHLYIFTSSEKKMCYKFTYKSNHNFFLCTRCGNKKYGIRAHICKNENGEEYISIQNKQHICEPAEYCPEKNEIIVKPNFQLFYYTKKGIKKKTLIVFCPTNMKLCYEFHWRTRSQRFFCLGCQNRRFVYAEIKTNANSEEYVKQRNQHVCELREFDPSKYPSDIIIEKTFYEIVEDNASKKPMKYLFIFTSTEKKMCYKFTYSTTYHNFYCTECHKQKHDIQAHICKSKNGEEYISIQDKQHICEPVEYCPEKLKYTIIKTPDYQIMKQRYKGRWLQKLFVFISKEKDFCYDYSWDDCKQHYVCKPCRNKLNAFVPAWIIKTDDGEEYVKLGWKEHVCKPVKYEPEESIFIRKPDFEIKNCIYRDREITCLFVTHPIDKKCYKYTLYKKQNRFICGRCHPKNVYAKLWKDENGEEFIELGKSEHVCQSKKEEPSGSNIINLPNFKVANNRKDLFIFDKNDKEKCYSYVYRPSTKNFLCRKCIAQKLRVSATLLQYPNGEEYLRTGKNDHICKPEKYQSGPINR